jgi:hypothetical protein
VHLLQIIHRTPRDRGYASFCPRFAEFINRLSPQGMDRFTTWNIGDHIKLPPDYPGLSFHPQKRIPSSTAHNHQRWAQIRPPLGDDNGSVVAFGTEQQSPAPTAPSIYHYLERAI